MLISVTIDHQSSPPDTSVWCIFRPDGGVDEQPVMIPVAGVAATEAGVSCQHSRPGASAGQRWIAHGCLDKQYPRENILGGFGRTGGW